MLCSKSGFKIYPTLVLQGLTFMRKFFAYPVTSRYAYVCSDLSYASVNFDGATYHLMESKVEEEDEKYPEICAQKEKLLDLYRQAISGWSSNCYAHRTYGRTETLKYMNFS